ncbi:HIT domain-containing protein [Pseudoxanthomonas dokdonensis]|uniref:Diadenosine tetraphosphate hydrolase n=1 Tax=Pseudoxanthomonas dokdonensis TaxID=344882 RepID=A0A0R0CR56_9GAMM|nr:HIT family protein [Pseudoxanthomonas dokdonensis]KRG68914.1 diadenosine tetraphosphate hydrolase [Pseudoxanthomonas dokdonensis]
MKEQASFELDARLAADSVWLADGPLSQIRLMNDSRYPWLLLVPRLAGASEWIELDGQQQRLLLAEVNQVGRALKRHHGVEKLNIGALGNMVRQLHVHLIGRHAGDPAWPGPVWGHGSAQPYPVNELQARIADWRGWLE